MLLEFRYRAVLQSLGATGALWVAAACVTLGGCAGDLERLATRAGLEQLDVAGGAFLHRTYRRDAPGDTLYLFIEGDGMPWLDGETPADDPTPRDPLTLRLLLRTPGPAVYVGRPCYFGVVDPACRPYYWTHGRFSPEVVASMRSVVDELIERSTARDCVLVGHSGGGTLALLMAPDLAHRCRVVTVAGLVDTKTWTDWHGYEPLSGSLNPAESIERVTAVPQLHLIGGRDRNIPPEQTKRALAGQPNAVVREFETFDHGCCWERAWRDILRTEDAVDQE